MSQPIKPLSSAALYHGCAPEKLGFRTTDDLDDFPGLIGQERAVEAIEFGTNIHRFGYNVFVYGPPGAGKHTLLRHHLKEIAAALAVSALAPWAIVPLLMIGGAFLCFEGFEKVAHKLLHSKEEDDAHRHRHCASVDIVCFYVLQARLTAFAGSDVLRYCGTFSGDQSGDWGFVTSGGMLSGGFNGGFVSGTLEGTVRWIFSTCAAAWAWCSRRPR